jgi:hypothetical protein
MLFKILKKNMKSTKDGLDSNLFGWREIPVEL